MDFHFRLGIAGHTGHGKTSLGSALAAPGAGSSGVRRRGGVTDFEFSPLTLPGARAVCIADLPSLENSPSWMVAGASGLDAVLLVMSCAEEVPHNMAEYIEILDLLDVRSGVVALTKSDLVGREALASAVRDAGLLVRGTFLEGAPIVPVSVMVKKGLPELLRELGALVERSHPRGRTGAFFMPIDRMSGVRIGAVVAGAPYRGIIQEGQSVEVMPSGRLSRASSIWSGGNRVEASPPGGRIEIGLDLVTSEQIRKGDVLCEMGRFAPTECIEVRLDALPSAVEPIAHLQRVRLLIGSFDVTARVSVLSGGAYRIEPGQSRVVQLLPERRVVTSAEDRFVILAGAPLKAVGGGRVLIPCAMRPHSPEEREVHESLLDGLAENWSPRAMLSAMVRERECIDAEELCRLSQIERAEFNALLADLREDGGPSGVEAIGESGRYLLSRAAGARIERSVLSGLEKFHRDRPELAGADLDDIRSYISSGGGFSFPAAGMFGDFLLAMLNKGLVGRAVTRGSERYHLPGFKPECGEAFAGLIGGLRAMMDAAGYELVETVSLAGALGIKPSDVTRALSYLRENDGVEVIGDGLLLSKGVSEKILEVIASMRGEISAAALMSKLKVNWRRSSAILAHFDSEGITCLSGERRLLRRRLE